MKDYLDNDLYTGYAVIFIGNNGEFIPATITGVSPQNPRYVDLLTDKGRRVEKNTRRLIKDPRK